MHNVDVKCVLITIDKARVKELSSKIVYRSLIGIIRYHLGGTILKESILGNNISTFMNN